MKTKIFLFISALFFSVSVFAQNKKLTIEDAVWSRWFKLAPQTLEQIDWRGDSYKYVYIEAWTNLYSADYNSDEAEKICTKKDVNDAILEYNPKLNKIKYFSDLKWLSENEFYQKVQDFLYVYNLKDKKIKQYFLLPQEAENVFYSPQAKAVAFTTDNNLSYINEKGKIIKISDESNKGIVYGSDYVHRQEFGIDKGIFWSPKGNYMAFYRKDETMVNDYPLVDYTTFPATLKSIKYPMAGQKSEEVTLGVYNLKTDETTYMRTGLPKEQYLTAITWGPEEEFIYIGLLNRDQNHFKFNKYNVETGKLVKTLFEESHDKYVEPEHPAIFLPENSNKFLWYSRKDGFNHLYLYDTEGNLIRQITKGQWEVTDFYGFTPDLKHIFIQSNADCAIQRHIYKVNFKNGSMDLLTKTEGMHSAKFTADKKYFIDEYSNIKTPGIIEIKNNKGRTKTELLESENALEDYNLGEIKIGTIKAADNETELYYKMVTPPDFDAEKKYPVIIYVYGGPHAQLVQDTWINVDLWDFYMAQKGYIVFTLDNRGSAYRGLEFENVIFRNVGVNEMKDQIKGVEFLKSKPFVDADRIGVHGWSYGGFMTISLMTQYPDLFKVGVAGGPVVDWKYYEVMYGERYMDTPKSNPDGYEQASLIGKINKLKGRLLVIQGGVDPVVVPQNSRSLLLKAQEQDIDIDFYEYPNSEHNVRGKKRIHLMKKVTKYFDNYL